MNESLNKILFNDGLLEGVALVRRGFKIDSILDKNVKLLIDSLDVVFLDDNVLMSHSLRTMKIKNCFIDNIVLNNCCIEGLEIKDFILGGCRFFDCYGNDINFINTEFRNCSFLARSNIVQEMSIVSYKSTMVETYFTNINFRDINLKSTKLLKSKFSGNCIQSVFISGEIKNTFFGKIAPGSAADLSIGIIDISDAKINNSDGFLFAGVNIDNIIPPVDNKKYLFCENVAYSNLEKGIEFLNSKKINNTYIKNILYKMGNFQNKQLYRLDFFKKNINDEEALDVFLGILKY
ncbi:hypothetical protein LMIY3S_02371 [Labrys miyagiensis]